MQTPQTPSQLLAANSNVQSPLIGYAIVGGYYPASSLTAGLTLTTTDYVQATPSMREPLTMTVQAGGVVRTTCFAPLIAHTVAAAGAWGPGSYQISCSPLALAPRCSCSWVARRIMNRGPQQQLRCRLHGSPLQHHQRAVPAQLLVRNAERVLCWCSCRGWGRVPRSSLRTCKHVGDPLSCTSSTQCCYRSMPVLQQGDRLFHLSRLWGTASRETM